MKRILAIVLWVFVFAFVSAIGGITATFALYVAGMEAWSDFFMKRIFPFIFIATPAFGLVLGLNGILWGTKQKKSKPSAVISGVAYLVLRAGLFWVFALIISPVALLLIWLMNYFDPRGELKLFDWIGVPITIASIFGLLWFANRTGQHMVFDERKFGAAVKWSFCDFQLRLAFLPLVGHWFVPRSDEQNRDNDDAS
jgi:hypothetical protein